MSDGAKLLESMSLELEACGEVSYEDPAPVVADLRRIAARLEVLERDAERLHGFVQLYTDGWEVDDWGPNGCKNPEDRFNLFRGSIDDDTFETTPGKPTLIEAIDAAINRAKETT
jgi:hypothetical protein